MPLNNRSLDTQIKHVYRRNWYDASDLLDKKGYTETIADYVDHQKRTCLHWAVMKGASPHLIKMLIRNYPQATLMRDYMGRVPIHIACECASDAIVHVLMDTTNLREVAGQRDFQCMRSLLAEAIINFRNLAITNAALHADLDQVLFRDYQGNTPLMLFMKVNLGRLCDHSRLVAPSGGPRIDVDELKQIASMLLKAEASIQSTGHIPIEQHEGLLFLAIKHPACPFGLVDFLLKEMNGLERSRNHHGELPIHSVVALDENDVKLYKCDDCGKNDPTKSLYFFHNEARTHRNILCKDCINQMEEVNYVEMPPVQKIKGTTKALLHLNPSDAKKQNQRGELPLHIAIKSGQCWSTGVIPELISAYPESLSIRDKETDLFPFQIAAVKHDFKYGIDVKEQSEEKLETIYQMLLKWPMAEKNRSSG